MNAFSNLIAFCTDTKSVIIKARSSVSIHNLIDDMLIVTPFIFLQILFYSLQLYS